MKIIKNYLDWIYTKIILQEKIRLAIVKEGEVYWCSLGENIGDEENGKREKSRRPVLILKKFNNNIFLGVPMTTKNKDSKYYIKIILKDKSQSAMISQVRVLDTKRLAQKIGYVSRLDLIKVKEEVSKMIIS